MCGAPFDSTLPVLAFLKPANSSGEVRVMDENQDELQPNVIVRRQWNDWRRASFPYDSISHLRWDNISGGAQVRAPQYFLHGYVFCNEMIAGEIAHSCAHGRGPHEIKVCILKSDNRKIYNKLIEGLVPKPRIMQWQKCQAIKRNGEKCSCRTRLQNFIGTRNEWRCGRHQVEPGEPSKEMQALHDSSKGGVLT